VFVWRQKIKDPLKEKYCSKADVKSFTERTGRNWEPHQEEKGGPFHGLLFLEYLMDDLIKGKN